MMNVKTIVNRVVLVWVLVIIVLSLLGRVSIAETKAGQTGADFLNIAIGARAASMGGAFTASSQGAVANYWNPAGLAFSEEGEALFSHFDWLQDLSLEYGAVAYPINDKLTLGGSITYMNYGQIDGYDDAGISTGDVSAYDLNTSISAGYKINDQLGVGLSTKYIVSSIDQMTGTAFVADLGMRWQNSDLVVAGFLGNFGTKLKYDNVSEKMPVTARVGVAYNFFNQALTSSVEYENRFSGNQLLKQGFEFNYQGKYFLRSGYNYNMNSETDSFGGITFGGGLIYNQFEVNYAFTPSGNFVPESLHRFSLIFRFSR